MTKKYQICRHQNRFFQAQNAPNPFSAGASPQIPWSIPSPRRLRRLELRRRICSQAPLKLSTNSWLHQCFRTPYTRILSCQASHPSSSIWYNTGWAKNRLCWELITLRVASEVAHRSRHTPLPCAWVHWTGILAAIQLYLNYVDFQCGDIRWCKLIVTKFQTLTSWNAC